MSKIKTSYGMMNISYATNDTIAKEWKHIDLTKPLEICVNEKANKRLVEFIKLMRFKNQYYEHCKEKLNRYLLGEKDEYRM